MITVGKLDDGRDLAITTHAAERILEMDIPAHRIFLTLNSPDETWESTKYRGTNYGRGDITFACTETDSEVRVITVLYRRMSAWIEADRGNRLPADRNLRTDTGIPR